MTGIDVSYAQTAVPAGTWDFIVCRASHADTGAAGETKEDVLFAQHFADAARAIHRGAYHFADPRSDGASQARAFVAICLARGFRPGVDSWTYDAERPGLTREHWLAFRSVALPALGPRRFLYIGWPFYEANFGGAPDLLSADPWWLPAYGPNDGTWHAPTGIPFLPVVHQYTSRGGPNLSGLDLNRVLDTATWDRIYAVPPAPKPVPPTQAPTIDHGDDHVKTTDIKGIHLDPNGNGEVAVKGVPEAHVVSTLVVGGADANAQHRYDKVPVTRVVAGSNPALIVIEGGEPSGVYTVRVAHA